MNLGMLWEVKVVANECPKVIGRCGVLAEPDTGENLYFFSRNMIYGS